MDHKLTGDQTERVFENLRFLQDTILLLEEDSAKKEAKAAQREKELMENKADEESDRLYLYEQNKHLEQIAKNLEYRLEEKAERELVLEMELERVKKLLNEMKLQNNKSDDTAPAGTTHSTPATNFKSVNSSTQAKTGNIAAGSDQAPSSTSTTNVNRDVSVMASYRLKMPMYKTGNDIETFVNRFEQFCQAQTVPPAQKANLILNALDDTTFTVVTRELTETERNNYNTVKEHLLKRFDILKEKGQRRLLLRQARTKPGQDLQSFYTEILTLAAKAYPGPHTAEQALITDEAIMDQLICGCEDEKMRLFLLDKSPKSSREALSLATSYQSALRYNDTIRDINTANTGVDAIATNSSAVGRSNYRDERNNYRPWNNGARSLRSQPFQYYRGRFNNVGRGHGQLRNDFKQRRDYFRETIGMGRNMNRGNFFNQAMNGRGNINRNWRQRSNSVDRYTPYNRPGTPTISPRRNREWNNQIIGNQLVESKTHDNSTENGEHIQAVNNAEENDRNTSIYNQQKPAYFLAGKLGDGEVFMLCDTGSSVSLIDDSIWENIKTKMGKLTEVNYSVRSASKHSLDILGETTLTFSLLTKKGSWQSYEFQFMVVRGLSKPVILGMNFFHAHKALIDVYNSKVFLYKGNTKTTYQLVGSTYYTSSTEVLLHEKLTIPPRTIMRIECEIDKDIEEGEQLIFEPNRELRALVAASVDVVKDKKITIEITNISTESVDLDIDTSLGAVEKGIEQHGCIWEKGEQISCAVHEFPIDIDWIKLIEMGDDQTPEEEKCRLLDLLKEYEECFSKYEGDVGRTNIIQHKIELEGEKPRRCAVRPLKPAMRDILEKELNDLKAKDFIQQSFSEYASPVVMVRKKDGSIRVCIDFRQLNRSTRKDSYPLPRISEVLDTLSGAKIFSTLDLKSGYHQIEMYPPDMPKTAFITQFGLYEWKVMPMGLCNAPGTFQRVMDTLMSGLSWKSVLVYLDDLIIFAKDYQEHFERISEVFERLLQARLKLSPKKCHFLQRKIYYLGHIIEDGKISPDPSKTHLIDTYPIPKNLKEVRSFTALVSYYRKYIKNFAQIAKPLSCLLEKNAKFNWTEDCQRAFDTLRMALSERTQLTLPDFSKPFQLACDASAVAVGAVLSQVGEDGREYPIAFASKVLSKTERNWSVTEREAYAIVWSVNYFRSFLLGNHFKLLSDHKPLCWLRNLKNPAPKLARWILQLEEYDFEVVYKEGKKHTNADAMSRLPVDANLCMFTLDSDLTIDELKRAQHQVPELLEIMTAIKTGNWTNIDVKNDIMKRFVALQDELFIDDETLYRQVDDGKCQIILAPPVQSKVLELVHTSLTGGHLGVSRTTSRLLDYFYWPSLRKITADYICRCLTCEKFKPPKENTRAELQPIKTTAVFELLEIDFIGPLPETTNGNKYILSVVDHFSKYAAAYATSKQDSKTVIDCLTKLFSEFGVPSKILSDQGRSFVSKEFQDFLKLWNVKKATATSYHPQTSGLVERFNGTVIRILKRYVYETQDKWDASLPYATYAYNTTVQRTNEFSPYEIIFGKKASHLLTEQLANKPENDTVNDYIARTRRQIQKICDIVIQNQEKARDTAKNKYDETARGSCFKVGDRVLLFNPAIKLGQNKKFTPAYVGPFTITEQQMETNFKIVPDDPKEKTQTVHQNRLKRFRGEKIHEQTTRTAAVEDSTVVNMPTNLSDIDSDSEEEDENEMLIIHFTKEEDDKVTEQSTCRNSFARNDSSMEHEQMKPNNTSPHDIFDRVIVRDIETHNESEAGARREDDVKENENTLRNEKEDMSNNDTSISNGNDTTNTSQDDSTYTPQRSITPPLPRRNPERNRRPPVRFNSADTYINLITVENKKSKNTKTQRNQTDSFSKWHIFSILIWSLLLRVGDAARWDIVTDIPATNVSTHQNETHTRFNSSENMASYFGKAHICGVRGEHASYIALPKIPDCKMSGQEDSGKIERVLVTPYFVPVFSDPIEAYACEVEKANLTTFLGFFGTKSILDRSLDYQPLNLELCRKEVKAIQEKHTHLTEIGHDIWSNSPITWDPQYEWCCKNVIHIRYRIRIRKITIRFNFHNHHVVSTMYPTEECNIDGDHCILKMATIVWSPAYHECDVHAGKTVFAERKWNNNMDSFDLVSEEGQLAVTGSHKTENHCDMELYPTNEGIYLKFGNAKLRPWSDSENMKEIKTTNKHALLHFVTKYMEKFSTNLFVRNWMSICEIQRQRYQMLRHFMANQNTAYLAARMLLQTPNVFAYPAGQLLQVHECTLIDEYYWEPDTSCYNTIPIRFKGKHKGFLVTETNDIKLMDSTCTCDDAMQRYMKTEDDKWYVWTGNNLETTHVYYHTIEMIRQMPEIKSLQLLPSHVDDPTADAIDFLSDMSTSITNNVLTLLRATGTDAVAFDPATVIDAAVKTAAMMETTVHAILNSISPFWRWLNIIILSAVSILVIGIIIFILVRIKNEMDKRKTDGMIEDMLKFTKERHARVLNSDENLSEKLLQDNDDIPLPPPPNMDEINMV